MSPSSRAASALGALLASNYARQLAHGRGDHGRRCWHRRHSDDRRGFDHHRRLGVLTQLGVVAGADAALAPDPSEPRSRLLGCATAHAPSSRSSRTQRGVCGLCVYGVHFCNLFAVGRKAQSASARPHRTHSPRPAFSGKEPPAGAVHPAQRLGRARGAIRRPVIGTQVGF